MTLNHVCSRSLVSTTNEELRSYGFTTCLLVPSQHSPYHVWWERNLTGQENIFNETRKPDLSVSESELDDLDHQQDNRDKQVSA
jgi:hypothetical protein